MVMGNNCAICNSPVTTRIVEGVRADERVFDVWFCKTCKVGFVLPVPLREDLASLYSAGSYRGEKGKRFSAIVELFIHFSRSRRKERIKKYVSGGTILDIGCGRGLFLDIMKRDGWTVAGVESDEQAASNISETYDIPVVSGEPSVWGFADGSFDVVTLSHVLEHLHNPVEIIRTCHRLLRKGGLLVCGTPNIMSLQASIGKGLWFNLDVPYHLYHFSEEGLVNLLTMHSFKIVRTRRFDVEYSPYGWLQTLLNISAIKKNYLYGLLKNRSLRKKETTDARTRDLLLTLGLLPVYLPLSFILSAFESFVLKKGGTVEIYALRE